MKSLNIITASVRRSVLGVVLVIVSPMVAAQTAYLSCVSPTQGSITAGASSAVSIGSFANAAHQDESTIISSSYQVSLPIDPVTGQPTGSRVHKPLILTKLVDSASPRFFQALASGARLDICTLSWYRTSATGAQELYYSITLTNSLVTALNAKQHNALDPNNSNLPETETLALSYGAISVRHVIAGVVASD